MNLSKFLPFKKKLAISTSIALGTFLLVQAGQTAQAEETISVEAVEALSAQYSVTKAQVTAENQQQQLAQYKEQLVAMIEQTGGQELLNQLQVEKFSVQELEYLFDAFIDYKNTLAVSANNTTHSSTQSMGEQVADEQVTENNHEDGNLRQAETPETAAEEQLTYDGEQWINQPDMPATWDELVQGSEEKVVTEEQGEKHPNVIKQEEALKELERQRDLEQAAQAEADATQKPEVVEESTAQEPVSDAVEATAEPVQRPQTTFRSRSASLDDENQPMMPTPRSRAQHAEATNQKPTLEETTYIVKAGDTLSKIAKEHETNIQAIVSRNRIKNPNHIRVGQRLIIESSVIELDRNRRQQNRSEVKPSTSMPFSTNNSFINSIAEYARQIAAEYNLYASVMVAQAALESGYGKSGLSLPPHHNLFGIKGSYNGNSANYLTSEYLNNQWVRVRQNFRSYPNYGASLRDNAKLLRGGLTWNNEFYKGTWVENTYSYKDATKWLTGRYATDPGYAGKLNRIIEQYDLTRLDVKRPNKTTPSTSQTTPNKPAQDKTVQPNKPAAPKQQESKPNNTHTVKYGDTLYRIALDNNTTIARLKTWNNLSSNLIVPGQVLKVAPETTQQTPAKPSSSKPTKQMSVTVTVQSGDTLAKIGNRYGVSVSNLVKWNNISNPNLIWVGQKLTVRLNVGHVKPSSSKLAKPAKPKAPRHYTVQRGDSLWAIAQKHNTTIPQLKQLNKLSSNLIHPGQQLRVR